MTVGTGRAGQRLLLRSVLAAVAGALAAVGSWLLLRRGIVTDDYPAFLPGTDSTAITRYSGPWLTAAAAVGLVAALLVLWAGITLLRWRRSPVA